MAGMVTPPARQAAAVVTVGRAGEAARDWVGRLSSAGAERDAAIAELHGLLLRAARFEIGRCRAAFPQLDNGDQDDLALQAADDAMISILRRLGDFRGQSRFTTWAYKFAMLEAGVKARRHAWQGREILLDVARWPTLADGAPTPQQHAEARDLLLALREEIESKLTAHQRQVLVAIALDGIPIDVLAERLNTSRGALYKTLHDARQKLRIALEARGWALTGMNGGARP